MSLSLKQVQAAMRRSIVAGASLTDQAPLLGEQIAGHGLQPDQRVGIYRNAYRESLTDSLAACFTSVEAFVGSPFFRAAARDFIQKTPPVEARLCSYGAGFGAFLRAWPHARTIAYIGDLADLDFAISQSLNAADSPEVASAKQAVYLFREGRLRLQPHVRLVISAWPVGSLWMAAAGHLAPEAVDLDSGGQNALVVRRAGAVEVQMISHQEAHGLDSIRTLDTLKAAANGVANGAGDLVPESACEPETDLIEDLWHRAVFTAQPVTLRKEGAARHKENRP